VYFPEVDNVGRMETNLPALASSDLAPLPVSNPTRNPVAVYLAALNTKESKRGQLNALKSIVRLVAPTYDVASFPWAQVRYEHAQVMRSQLAAKYAPATANKALGALRRVLEESWRLGLIDAETYHRVRDVKDVRGSRLPAGRMLQAGEVRTMFESCAADATASSTLDAAVLALLLGCGLRRDEAVSLDLADYNAETGELRVQGKGNKQRLVHIVNGAAKALAAWLRVRGSDAGPLLCPVNRWGHVELRPMTAQAVYARLAARAVRAGVGTFSPHDLRRTFVSQLLDNGADVAAVQRLAGHANVQTTMRYDRRGEQAKRRAAELLHVPFVEA
jgi:site-specific recombinase XerD